MKVLPIVKEPHAILHAKACPVMEVTPEIDRLIDDMIETMHAANGVGLAANQVGSSWDILVASPDGKKSGELVLLNTVLSKRRGRAASPEGCLSLPGVSADVSRSAAVKASGLDRKGRPVTLSADGLLAAILQHEADHLQGRLFVDRLGAWRRRRILRRYRSITETLRTIRV